MSIQLREGKFKAGIMNKKKYLSSIQLMLTLLLILTFVLRYDFFHRAIGWQQRQQHDSDITCDILLRFTTEWSLSTKDFSITFRALCYLFANAREKEESHAVRLKSSSGSR
jgi:hypothetical protein